MGIYGAGLGVGAGSSFMRSGFAGLYGGIIGGPLLKLFSGIVIGS